MKDIRGILFDSGDTLARPIAGTWFAKQHFLDAFRVHGVVGAHMDRFQEALRPGLEFLDDQHHLAVNEDVEQAQFRDAYRLILEGLGVRSPSEELVTEVLRPFEDGGGIEPFEDVHRVLAELRRQGFKLGIVSDNWPSLDGRYRALGLRGYFDAFVISALVGSSKPCSRIYRAGLKQIGLPAEGLLFVDDRPGNVEAAISLGMSGVVIDRYGSEPDTALPVVTNLDAIAAMLG